MGGKPTGQLLLESVGYAAGIFLLLFNGVVNSAIANDNKSSHRR